LYYDIYLLAQEEYTTALEIFDLMNESSAIPDRLTYGVAMTACMHTANSKQADILFQRCNEKFKYGSSKKYSIEDTAMFSLMIATWDVVGSWSKVIVTYDEIDALDGLKPSVDMINSALRASKRQQDWIKYDNVVSTLAVLDNIKKIYSATDDDADLLIKPLGALSRKSMRECLVALEASTSTDSIGTGMIYNIVTHRMLHHAYLLLYVHCSYSPVVCSLFMHTINVHSQFSWIIIDSILTL